MVNKNLIRRDPDPDLVTVPVLVPVPVPSYTNLGVHQEYLQEILDNLPNNNADLARGFVDEVMKETIHPMLRTLMIDSFLMAIQNWENIPQGEALTYLAGRLNPEHFPVKLQRINKRLQELQELAGHEPEVPLMEQFKRLPKPKPVTRRVLLEAAGQEAVAYEELLQELQAHHSVVGPEVVTPEEAEEFKKRLSKAREVFEEEEAKAKRLEKSSNREDKDEDMECTMGMLRCIEEEPSRQTKGDGASANIMSEPNDVSGLPESEGSAENLIYGTTSPQVEQKIKDSKELKNKLPSPTVESLTTVNVADNSVPEVVTAEVEYVESDDLNDLEDVDTSLKTLLSELDSKEWVSVCEALNNVRRLSIFHKEMILGILDKVISLIVKSLKNPRSAVCKTALMACSDIFKAYRDDLIDLLDPMLVQLLLKSSQDKKFVCEAAERALISMTTWVSPVLLLPKLQPDLKNSNPQIRAKAAMCFVQSAPRLGIDGINAYGIDKLIEIAISQLSDKLPESREAARTLLLELQSVYEKSNAPKADNVSDETEVISWEEFCLSNFSFSNAQVVLRVTTPKEGAVGS